MTQMMAPHRRSASSSHLPKSKTTVTARPGAHRRGTSAITLSISKLGSGHSPRSHSRGTITADDDLDMAASFLNFCCRRKDSAKPLSASVPPQSTLATNHHHHYRHSSPYTNTSSTPIPMSVSPPTSPPLSPRTIVAPMTPTRVPSSISASLPSIRIPPAIHNAKSDLDPTEWKPVLGPRAISITGTTGVSPLATSDAWSYLSHFHGGASTMLARRPHRSTTSLSALDGAPTPSLTHAASVASSVSSTASSDEHKPEHEHGYEYGGPSPLAHRPLPPRHNPSFSLSHAVENGVALVVPHVAAVAVQDVESDSGSIFPASSAVWEDDAKTKRTCPILMRGSAQKGKA
ncbi:hypothetical protein POX_d05862 [Penicillium oxalicum]|uniref:hypothetical protein n=1 Tax=Penicillium oxalicum TaxID=69781 RepID=UPI0020B7D7DB|nr:hypothetical protein POX_d05862 [Penicillium oxalicum]KAI2790352.1 hypothetical protein POX_d05862 [Penicillium oxalicum]